VSLEPTYYSQIYPFSCVPACLRIVLSAYEFEISEPTVRQLAECDETGTKPSNAVKAARELGFLGSYVANLELLELTQLLSEGLFPIVYLRFPQGGRHAVVVTGITQENVSILDPEDPTRTTLNKSSFENMAPDKSPCYCHRSLTGANNRSVSEIETSEALTNLRQNKRPDMRFVCVQAGLKGQN
jgi:ABC-type bacteriocin/lantibiotic exporter with double-glycine peptidase domain